MGDECEKRLQIRSNGKGHILGSREDPVPVLSRSSSARTSSAAMAEDGADARQPRRRLTADYLWTAALNGDGADRLDSRKSWLLFITA